MTAERDVCPHPDSIPIWVTVTHEDALTWSELDDAARDLGGYAAVLHGDGPSVVSRLRSLHRRGVRNVVLAAVTVSGGRVPRAFLGRVARWWLADRASEMTVRVARETTHGIPTTAPTADASRTLRPDPSGLSSVAWEGVPPSAHHVLVCRGPRCSARGAGDVAAAIEEALQHRGLRRGRPAHPDRVPLPVPPRAGRRDSTGDAMGRPCHAGAGTRARRRRRVSSPRRAGADAIRRDGSPRSRRSRGPSRR